MKKIFDDASFFFSFFLSFFLSFFCVHTHKRGDATGKSAARGRTTTGEKREDNAAADDVFVFIVFVSVHVSVHAVVVAFFDEIWSVVVDETSDFGSRKEWSDSKRAHQRLFFFFFE
jgi:hypothetical protein